jgi:hypothetical protein
MGSKVWKHLGSNYYKSRGFCCYRFPIVAAIAGIEKTFLLNGKHPESGKRINRFENILQPSWKANCWPGFIKNPTGSERQPYELLAEMRRILDF